MKLGRSKDRTYLQCLLPRPFSLVFLIHCFHNYYHPLADRPIQLVVSFFITPRASRSQRAGKIQSQTTSNGLVNLATSKIAQKPDRQQTAPMIQALSLVHALTNNSQGEYRKREQQQMSDVPLLTIHLLTNYCNKYFRKFEGSDFSFPSFFKQIKGHELKVAS